MHYHNSTRIIRTKGIVSDGKHLTLTDIQQPGFEWWVKILTRFTSFCGGDFEGRISLPKWCQRMVIHHEAVVQALEDGQWNGQPIKAGALYVPMPGRRRCIEFPERPCTLGDEACGLYVNRGTSRWHGYATVENLEDPHYLIPLPDDLADNGFLVEPLAICQHLIRAALEMRLLPCERVAIVGLGVLGLFTAAELVERGIQVVGFDMHTGPRREAFDMLGPLATFVESKPDEIQANAGQFPLVVEIAGGRRSLADAVTLVAMGGAVLAVGIPMDTDGVSPHNPLVVKGATVKGIVSAERIDFLQAVNSLQLWEQNRPDFLERIVTHRIPYTQFEDALALDPTDRVKVALTFS